MFKSSLTYVTITTVILLVLTVLGALNFSFPIVFYLTIIGQISLIIMVYKVLTDNYTTDKTFDDFYEDRPIKTIDVKAENENYRR